MQKISSIHAAVSIQYRRVRDGQTDGHTTTANTRASIASHRYKVDLDT